MRNDGEARRRIFGVVEIENFFGKKFHVLQALCRRGLPIEYNDDGQPYLDVAAFRAWAEGRGIDPDRPWAIHAGDASDSVHQTRRYY